MAAAVLLWCMELIIMLHAVDRSSRIVLSMCALIPVAVLLAAAASASMSLGLLIIWCGILFGMGVLSD
jgi:hypothetical protein